MKRNYLPPTYDLIQLVNEDVLNLSPSDDGFVKDEQWSETLPR